MTIKSKRVGFLGAGNMGEAMIKGLTQAGLVPAASIGATDARADRLDQMTTHYGIRAFASNPALVAESDVIILAVKPQIMATVLREIAAAVDGTKLIISLAAGVATRTLREHLGKPARLIRVMPNTPALVLEGATAIARAEGLEAGDLEIAQALFGAVGQVVVLDEDHLMRNRAFGLRPGYIAIVIEALADGGVRWESTRHCHDARTQTVLGSAKLLLETGMHPGSSRTWWPPGRTTIAGIAALEDGGIRRPSSVPSSARRCARGAGAPVVVDLIRFIGGCSPLLLRDHRRGADLVGQPRPRNPIGRPPPDHGAGAGPGAADAAAVENGRARPLADHRLARHPVHRAGDPAPRRPSAPVLRRPPCASRRWTSASSSSR